MLFLALRAWNVLIYEPGLFQESCLSPEETLADINLSGVDGNRIFAAAV